MSDHNRLLAGLLEALRLKCSNRQERAEYRGNDLSGQSRVISKRTVCFQSIEGTHWERRMFMLECGGYVEEYVPLDVPGNDQGALGGNHVQ